MPREFWVNAGKSYVLPVSIITKTAITWEFTTEPKVGNKKSYCDVAFL